MSIILIRLQDKGDPNQEGAVATVSLTFEEEDTEAPSTTTTPTLETTTTSALDCGDGKIRGVNAGGWLLLEPWITPKLFEEVSSIPLEYRKLYKDIQCSV